MSARRVARRGDFRPGKQRMAFSRHTHEPIAKERLDAQLRPDLAEHPDLEIDEALPERPRILVGLRREAQANAWSGIPHGGQQTRAEGFNETVVGPNGEASLDAGDFGSKGRGLQQRHGLLRRLPDAIAKLLGMRGWNKLLPGANEERVARCGAQSRQRATHRRCAEAKPPRGARHAALGEQSVQRCQEIEVYGGHSQKPSTPARAVSQRLRRMQQYPALAASSVLRGARYIAVSPPVGGFFKGWKAMQSSQSEKRLLLFGGSRGLGLAIAEEYLKLGWRVVATARSAAGTALHDLAQSSKGQLEVEQVDIADPAQIMALHQRLKSERFDLLLVNAGVTNDDRETIADVSTEEFVRVMVTNALSPLRVIETFQDLVPPTGAIAIMSSGQGSVTNNENGGHEVYRASKAALNTLMRSFAARHRDDPRTLLLLAPGWVRTDMGGPNARLSIEESIPNLVKVIEAQQGKPGLQYLDYLGRTVPW